VLACEPEDRQQCRAQFLASHARIPLGRREVHPVRVADSSVAHYYDPVGERDGFIDVVGDEQHGCVMFATELAHQIVHS
jgi:hypothetical protein